MKTQNFWRVIKMVKIQIELSEKENLKVRNLRFDFRLDTKAETIRKIIRDFKKEEEK